MKKTTLSALAVVALTNFGFAGGDIVPVAVEEVPVVVEHDNSGLYLGLALTAVSTRGFGADLDIFKVENNQDRLGNITLLVGYEFNKYMAAEARYTKSVFEEDIVDMSAWSIFAKPQYPVTEAFTIYGLLGYGGVNWKTVDAKYPIDLDDTGFQWGLGLSYAVTENITLFGDYTSLGKNMAGTYKKVSFDADTDAFTLGLTYRF